MPDIARYKLLIRMPELTEEYEDSFIILGERICFNSSISEVVISKNFKAWWGCNHLISVSRKLKNQKQSHYHN